MRYPATHWIHLVCHVVQSLSSFTKQITYFHQGIFALTTLLALVKQSSQCQGRQGNSCQYKLGQHLHRGTTQDMSWPWTLYLKPNKRAVSSILIRCHVKGGSWLKSLKVKSKSNFRGIYMNSLREKPTSYFNRLAIHLFPKHLCIWTETRG